MKGAPKGAKKPTGFTEQGGSPDGSVVFFGFQVGESEQIFFEMNHANLADTIRWLTKLAHESHQRRLKANPATEFREVDSRPDTALRQFYFDGDVTGQIARLMGTSKDGLPVGSANSL
jgi:hypothetical protein